MNKGFLIGIILTICIIAISCKSAKEVSQLTSQDIRFSLVKGPCFGQCAAYTLTIYEGGYSTYEGGTYSIKKGKYGKQLDKKIYKNLIKRFENVKFSKYPKDFESLIPDLPLVTIGYHDGTQYMSTKGRENRPEDLMQLQFELEKVADSENWDLLEAPKVPEKPESVTIFTEIIIEPFAGTQMAKWFESYNTYGLRLIKKIAPGLDLYLITYTHDTADPEDLIKILRADKNIKTAEFNKKTSKRK